MRIMSFNVLVYGPDDKPWTKRAALVTEQIKQYDPDTFGLQEAHIGWMKAVSEALPEYGWVGVGRDDGKEEGEFSPVFYKKDKFTALDCGNFWLSETPEKPGKGWDAACIRICSWALLEEKATGKKFVHFNTHLDHVGEVAMQKGAELVATRSNELFTGIPAVFTGDFNVTPESAPCAAVRAGGFADSRDVAPVTDTGNTFHGYRAQEGLSVIDYVFVNNLITVEKFAVVREKINGIYPSDHWAVYSDINF